jgi:hypothetical protein
LINFVIENRTTVITTMSRLQGSFFNFPEAE